MLAAGSLAQVELFFPGEADAYRGWYGEPLEVSVASLSRTLGTLQGQAVRVRGDLVPAEGNALSLREGGDAVLLIPVVELRLPELSSLIGRRVEVLGAARRLPERQDRVPCHDVQAAPESWCEDPELPPLPDRGGHPTWPRNSVTFWGIIDATPGARAEANREASALQAVVADPSRFEDSDVTLVGRFRGANLFGDLPTTTRLDEADWVIADGDAALWVTGKPPRGDGWRLSLRDESESRWWIEVRGRIEVRDGIPYLQAKQLRLRPAPR
jgi:hypothetical protein